MCLFFYDLTLREDVPQWFKDQVDDVCYENLCAMVGLRVDVNNSALLS